MYMLFHVNLASLEIHTDVIIMNKYFEFVLEKEAVFHLFFFSKLKEH